MFFFFSGELSGYVSSCHTAAVAVGDIVEEEKDTLVIPAFSTMSLHTMKHERRSPKSVVKNVVDEGKEGKDDKDEGKDGKGGKEKDGKYVKGGRGIERMISGLEILQSRGNITSGNHSDISDKSSLLGHHDTGNNSDYNSDNSKNSKNNNNNNNNNNGCINYNDNTVNSGKKDYIPPPPKKRSSGHAFYLSMIKSMSAALNIGQSKTRKYRYHHCFFPFYILLKHLSHKHIFHKF